MHAQLLQSRLTPCDPMDCSPQAPLSMEILQARILEWVAMPSSRGLPHPGIEPESPVLTTSATFSFHLNWKEGKKKLNLLCIFI